MIHRSCATLPAVQLVSRMIQLIAREQTRNGLAFVSTFACKPWSTKRNESAEIFRDQHSNDAVELLPNHSRLLLSRKYSNVFFMSMRHVTDPTRVSAQVEEQ